MSIAITDEAMTCTHSTHWAWPDRGGWVVTWLGQPVDRDAAITALHLAELLGGGSDYDQMSPQQRQSLATAFAIELGLSSEQAAARIYISEQQAQNLQAGEPSSAVSEDW